MLEGALTRIWFALRWLGSERGYILYTIVYVDVSLVWSNLYDRVVLGTNTDSTTTSEDDRVPPPLPAKNREVDYISTALSTNHEVTSADSPPLTRQNSSTTPPIHRIIDKVRNGGLFRPVFAPRRIINGLMRSSSRSNKM